MSALPAAQEEPRIVVPPLDDATIARVLANDRVCARVLAKGRRPADGQLIGVRLNLNLFTSQKVTVQTLHAGKAHGGHRRNMGFYNNEVLWYEQIVTVADAFFNVNQRGRERIASGATHKYPMASVDGVYLRDAAPDFDGVEIRFNPFTVHLFVDADNRPVRWAERVTVYGHRAYARGRIEYYTAATAPRRAGLNPSAVVFG